MQKASWAETMAKACCDPKRQIRVGSCRGSAQAHVALDLCKISTCKAAGCCIVEALLGRVEWREVGVRVLLRQGGIGWYARVVQLGGCEGMLRLLVKVVVMA